MKRIRYKTYKNRVHYKLKDGTIVYKFYKQRKPNKKGLLVKQARGKYTRFKKVPRVIVKDRKYYQKLLSKLYKNKIEWDANKIWGIFKNLSWQDLEDFGEVSDEFKFDYNVKVTGFFQTGFHTYSNLKKVIVEKMDYTFKKNFPEYYDNVDEADYFNIFLKLMDDNQIEVEVELLKDWR